MLKKSTRLTTTQFAKHFKTGRRVHGSHLQLIYSPLPTFHGSVVVGKKVYKKAVDRNRLRRRLYGVLYQQHKSQPLTGVYIVVAKPSASEVQYHVVRDELQSLIGRISKNKLE